MGSLSVMLVKQWLRPPLCINMKYLKTFFVCLSSNKKKVKYFGKLITEEADNPILP